MHFHLPKPLHGWREFVGEIAIIVIGVLIALGAEQVVEHWRWEHKVAAAERSMNEEIKNSLLGVIEMDRLQKCSAVQLDALQNAIARGDQIKAKHILDQGGAFMPNRLWADNAFQATLAAQVSDHLGADKLKSYSQVYQMIRDIRRVQEASEDATSDLAVLYFLPEVPTSPASRYAQLREVTNDRLRTTDMRDTGAGLVRYAKNDLRLQVTEREYLAAPGRIENIKRCETGAAAVKS